MRVENSQNLPLNLQSEAVKALALAGQALQAIALAFGANPPENTLTSSSFADVSSPLVFGDAPTCVEVINELLKAKAGRDEAYLKYLRHALRKFAQSMNNCQLTRMALS